MLKSNLLPIYHWVLFDTTWLVPEISSVNRLICGLQDLKNHWVFHVVIQSSVVLVKWSRLYSHTLELLAKNVFLAKVTRLSPVLDISARLLQGLMDALRAQSIFIQVH